MKRRKHLRGLATAALELDLLSLPLAPVLARQCYVDLLFYQEMLWDRSLVWQDPRGAASILLWWALGGCAATPTGERWKQKMFGGGDEGDK